MLQYSKLNCAMLFSSFYLLLMCCVLLFHSVLGSELPHHKLLAFTNSFSKHAILAFGDSLTRGLYVKDGNQGHHPYSNELTRRINSSSIRVLEHGINGEVTSKMIRRLPSVLSHHKLIKLVVIIGGTNDLTQREDPHIILANLIRLHQTVHKMSKNHSSILSVAVAIPQMTTSFIDQSARIFVNKGLLDYAQQHSNLVLYRDFEGVFDQEVPASTAFWSDDLQHLSPAGYDLMGQLLYNDIVEFAYRLSLVTTNGTTTNSAVVVRR
jgi:lysophospholipase L1-like esterase